MNFKKLATLMAAMLLTASTTAFAGNHKGDHDKKSVDASYGDKPSIVEIAVEDESFTTLVALLKQAELVETLSGEGPFTVFAPTNEAFEKVPQETLAALGQDKEALKKVLLYHVAAGNMGATDVVGKDKIKMVSGEKAYVKTKYDKVKVSGASVKVADIKASNGVIHVIDSVMLPPSITGEKKTAGSYGEKKQSIVDIATGTEDFSTLTSLLVAADLVETLKGDGPFTVFAPTNDAFAKLPAEAVAQLKANPEQLRAVLLYHVAPGKLKAAKVVKADMVETAQGDTAKVTVTDGVAKIDDATILKTDIMASNGVIHVIDSVILPDTTQGR